MGWLSLMRIVRDAERDVQTMKFVLRLAESIDAFALNRTLAQPAAGFDECAKLRETRIFRQSLLIARVDLLHDDRDLQ